MIEDERQHEGAENLPSSTANCSLIPKQPTIKILLLLLLVIWDAKRKHP